jgi:predicted ArsR family transcriptional regulator
VRWGDPSTATRWPATRRRWASNRRRAGREQGEVDAAGWQDSTCLDALVAQLDALGFDPAVVRDAAQATVAFTHCPFRDLAEAEPDLVCGLHRGMVEGFVAAAGAADTRVMTFHPLLDRTPCQVTLALADR